MKCYDNFLIKLVLTFSIVIYSAAQVFSHSVQVQYCVSCSGDLRIWLEHWHGSEDPNTTTMTISLTVNGVTNTITSSPGGGVIDIPYGQLPGCSTPITYAAGCPGDANTYNDWVYYDFVNLPSNVPISFTIISGNTVFTTDACGMYPLTVNFQTPNLVPVVFSIAESDYNGYNISCNGASDGAIDVDVTSVVPGGYAFLWNTGQTTEDLANISAGSYHVDIMGLNSCTTSATINITEPTPIQNSILTTDYNGYDISCNGYNDAAIDLTTNGSVPGYDYLWSTGDTTEDISNLSAGTYSVDVTDANSCVQTTNVVLCEPLPLATTIASSTNYNGYDISCNGYSDGGIDLTVSGGTNANVPACAGVSQDSTTSFLDIEITTDTWGYETSWDLVDQNGSVVASGSGYSDYTTYNWSVLVNDYECYTFTIYDSYGDGIYAPGGYILTYQGGVTDGTGWCCYSQSINIGSCSAPPPPPPPPITPSTFIWSNGETTEDISNLSAGTYSVNITDGNGCPISTSIVLSEPDFSINPTVNHESCLGLDGGISLNPVGDNPPFSCSWIGPSGPISDDTSTISMLSSGDYYVTITDNSGCSILDTFFLQLGVLSTNVTIKDVSCFGFNDGEISLAPTGGAAPFSYSWIGPAGAIPYDTSTISMLSPGNYQVTVTGIANCFVSESYIVQEPTPLQTSIVSTTDYNGFDISCNGYSDGGIDLTVSGSVSGYTFLWDNNEVTEDLSNATEGINYVDITDINSCTTSTSITLIEPTPLQTSIVSTTDYNGFDISCNGYSDGGIDLTVSGSVSGYTFLWDTGENTEDIGNLTEGAYDVVVTDDNSCIITTSIILFEPTPLQALIVPTNYNGYNISCNGYSDGGIDLTVSGSVPGYTYLWDNNDTTEDITSLQIGTYSVDITDLNSCTTSTSITLIEPTPLQTSIVSTTDYNGFDISCNGYSDGGGDLTVTGSVPAYSYLWANGETNSNANSLFAGFQNVLVTDINSCSVNLLFNLLEPTSLQTTIVSTTDYNGFDISCNGYSDGGIDLTVSGSVPGYTYLWDNTAATEDIMSLSAATYSVDITDINSCTTSTSITLVEPTPLVSSYTASDINGYNVCFNGTDGSINLTVSGSVPAYSYQWSTGDNTQDLYNLTADVYYYTSTDLNGCITEDSVIITQPIYSIQENIVDVSCFDGIDGSVSVTVSGSTPPYYVFWDNNIDTSSLEADMYSYQIIDSIGCVYQESLIVSEPTPLIVVENITGISCFGGNDGAISLNVSGATPPYNVLWGTGQVSNQISNLYAGTYNVTIIDSNQCEYSEIYIVNQPNPIDVTYTISLPYCVNSTNGAVAITIVGGTSPYIDDWGPNTNPNSLAVGTYEFVVTDFNGCTDTNSVNLVERSDMYVFEESINVSCEGFCDGSTDLIISNGVLPYSINWFGVNSDSLCVGVHYFDVVDSLGCVYSDSVLIISPDSIVAQINQSGSILTTTANGGVPPYFCTWFNQNNQLSTTCSQPMTYIGDYYCVVYDSQHCQSDTLLFSNHISGTDDINISNLLIYPNPSDGIINIEFSSDITLDFSVSLINVIGQVVIIDKKELFSGEYVKQVDVSNYANGIYLIEVKTDSGVINKKLILQ